jgi:hypothetical protein
MAEEACKPANLQTCKWTVWAAFLKRKMLKQAVGGFLALEFRLE